MFFLKSAGKLLKLNQICVRRLKQRSEFWTHLNHKELLPGCCTIKKNTSLNFMLGMILVHLSKRLNINVQCAQIHFSPLRCFPASTLCEGGIICAALWSFDTLILLRQQNSTTIPLFSVSLLINPVFWIIESGDRNLTSDSDQCKRNHR